MSNLRMRVQRNRSKRTLHILFHAVNLSSVKLYLLSSSLSKTTHFFFILDIRETMWRQFFHWPINPSHRQGLHQMWCQLHPLTPVCVCVVNMWGRKLLLNITTSRTLERSHNHLNDVMWRFCARVYDRNATQWHTRRATCLEMFGQSLKDY